MRDQIGSILSRRSNAVAGREIIDRMMMLEWVVLLLVLLLLIVELSLLLLLLLFFKFATGAGKRMSIRPMGKQKEYQQNGQVIGYHSPSIHKIVEQRTHRKPIEEIE